MSLDQNGVLAANSCTVFSFFCSQSSTSQRRFWQTSAKFGCQISTLSRQPMAKLDNECNICSNFGRRLSIFQFPPPHFFTKMTAKFRKNIAPIINLCHKLPWQDWNLAAKNAERKLKTDCQLLKKLLHRLSSFVVIGCLNKVEIWQHKNCNFPKKPALSMSDGPSIKSRKGNQSSIFQPLHVWTPNIEWLSATTHRV